MHELLCGDATQPSSYSRLLAGEKAQLILTDPPYNVKIAGHVRSSRKYQEFVMASGEMTETEFAVFLKTVFAQLQVNSQPGRAAQSTLVESGRVWIPEGASWIEEFKREVNAFPRGAHDDQLDALAQLLKREEEVGDRFAWLDYV